MCHKIQPNSVYLLHLICYCHVLLRLLLQLFFFFKYFCLCQKSNEYSNLFNINLFRGNTLIPGENLAHKHESIKWIIIFFDKFAMFNPNVHEMTNLSPSLRCI